MTPEETIEFIKCARDPIYFMNTYGYIYDITKSTIDRLSLFDIQKDVLENYVKNKNNIILKSRQCVPFNTFIDTPDGPKAIQEFKIGDLVYSYNLITNIVELDTVADAWYSGEKPCIKIKLKDSRNVEVGENHPYWIVNKQEWIKAKDLEINDEILDANIGFGDISANEDEIKLLGYLITDGCTNKQVKFTNNSLDYLLEFEESSYKCFPQLEIRKTPKNNGFDYAPHQKHGVSTINPIMEWCETKGIANKKTEFKNLPEEVFYWDKKSISLLINRIFAGDGWVSVMEKTTGNKRLELGLGSPSLIFLEQIKFLLKKYNIKGNIYEVKNMKLQKNKFYKFRITHSKSASQFVNEIGIYKKIKPEHLEIIKNRKHDVKNTSLVRKIEKTEIKKCYDISVTKNENFLINGLLVHNTGISVITSGYVCWKMLFNENERILIVANDGAGARRFLGSVKQFLEYLPAFLRPDVVPTNNTQQIIFSNGSWCKAVASGSNAGRGETISLLVMDEVAFIENAEEIWMASALALSAEKAQCIMVSCVPKDTMVFTNSGIKKIENFIIKENSGGYEIGEYKVFGKDKLRTGNLFFNNGFKETKILKSTNAEFEGTLNHKLWACKNGVYDWYKTEDLNEGDYISIQYGMETWGNNDEVKNFNPSCNGKIINKFNPNKITTEIAYLIGLYISEGSSYKKHNANNEFIGGAITITCGDDVSKSILDAGLPYSSWDNLHYSIGSKNFIEFLEHIGFDLKKHANEKVIPERLMEMSRENIVYMLRGIFDGDGYSRKDKGYIGIGMSSKKLIQQIRMLLLNFGVLTDYYEVLSKVTKKIKVESMNYRISTNGEFSKVFYDKIGFNFKRKQDNEIILEKYNLNKNIGNDIIPFSLNLIKKMFFESGLKQSNFKKQGIKVCYVLNTKNKPPTDNVSRGLFLKMYKLCKDLITDETKKEIEKILSPNLKWNAINKIENSESETYDFSLPDNSDDFWCHSVIYNGVLGHQTPNGSSGLYHATWTETIKKQKTDKNAFVGTEVHWNRHPYYAEGLEQRIDDHGKKFWWSPWYEKQCELLKWDKVKIAQELDLSFEGSAAVVIEAWIIDRYESNCADIKPVCYYDYKEPAERFVSRETRFYVWEKPQPKRNYIIGGDVSRGDGEDFSTLQVIDADTLNQVAEYQGKIPPDVFAALVSQVATDYNMAFVAVECNNHGLVTTLAIKNVLKYPSDKIHHSKSIKKIYVRHGGVDYVDQDSEIPGFQTTTKTRPLLMSCLAKYMREAQVKINSKRLLAEFRTFINKGDKPEHADGYHDDLIFAFAIALFMRDTEFDNVFKSKEFFKAMLDSISYQSNSAGSRGIPTNTQKNDGMRTNSQAPDSDLGWLYGPISTG